MYGLVGFPRIVIIPAGIFNIR